ncbi:MAG: tetratricopeptide repeat protein [Crocinitomicaceae bacterium]|nr:tetratricopeptide repeat protein [Crocinitomicaceae bacterium]
MKYLIFLVPFLLFSCGKKEDAVSSTVQNLDSLIKVYPDSVELLILHGKKMIKNYRLELALSDGAKAFRLDSMNNDARLLYADALNNRPNRTPSDVARAQKFYAYLLKKMPKDPKIYVSLASTYSQQMDFDKSFLYINQALKINPRYRDAYVMKGSNYLFLNKIDLAKSSYETAVQQDPKFFEAYLMLGSLYQAENDKICLEYYKTAAELQPKNVDVIYSLAYAEQVFGQTYKALAHYKRMLQLKPDYHQALNQIGVIQQYNLKQLDSAMYYYNSALEVEPRFVEAWHNLGECYESQKDITHALQSYAKALKYDPSFELSRQRADALKGKR